VSDAELSTALAEELKFEAPSEFPSWVAPSVGVGGISTLDSPDAWDVVPSEFVVVVSLFSELLEVEAFGRVNNVAAPTPSIGIIPPLIFYSVS